MAGITRGGAWAGRRVASCVLGEGANELAEASIIATTKVRIMMMATAQPATAANLDVSLIRVGVLALGGPTVGER